MKTLGFLLFALVTFAGGNMFAQGTFYVSGNKISDPCGDQFIPRGINYPVLDDWDFPANMNNGNEQSAEIMKANPNIVRIAWYNDYGQAGRPAFALSDLDSIISRFSRKGIVSVINIMDVTCSNDYTAFTNRVANWWIKPDVVALVQKHKSMVMANIANEFGYVNWAGTPAAALITWKDNYKQMITSMRNAGITVPIMIDAPDCGTSIDVLLGAGAEFLLHDPKHNIICSAHAYWGLDDSAAVATKVQQAAAASFPVILGEVANYQTDAQPCQYNIQLTSILRACQQNQTGWMAWCWYKDHCPSRQLTTDGTFANLSPYGQLIINDGTWGLATKAPKTFYLLNNGNCSTGINKFGKDDSAIDWYQPQRMIVFNAAGAFALTDMTGHVVSSKQVRLNESYTADASLPTGVYVVRFVTGTNAPVYTKVLIGNY